MDDHSNDRIRWTESAPSPSAATSANAHSVQAQELVFGLAGPGLRHFRARGILLVTKCEDLARRAPLRFSLLTTAVLLALVFASLKPGFQSNDDPQLAMIAAGKGTCLAPDEHLIFTNVVIGHLLKSLYLVCPAIPWYGAYLYLVQYLAQVAILYCTIAAKYTRLRLGLYLLFFGTVGMFLLSNLQYTTTASLAGQSGALLCLAALRRQAAAVPVRKVWRMLGSGVALLVLASLIRLECFYLTLLVMLPAVICSLGWPPRRAVLLSAAGAGGICLSFVLGLASYNDAYYAHDPEWRHFYNFNKLRVKFNDYGWTSYTPQTAPLFEKVNWSENDHAMIANWFFADPVVYSETRLRQVLDGYPWRNARLTAEYWWYCASTIWGDRSLYSIVLVLPLFLACAIRSRQNMMAYLGSAVLAVTLLGVIAMFSKPPPNRVYFPLLTFPFVLLLLMARDCTPRQQWGALAVRCIVSLAGWRRRVTFRSTLVHALALFGVVYGVSHHYRSNHRMQRARHDFSHTLADVNWSDDRLYVVWAPGFRYELISPFDNLSSFSNFHQIVIGWPQRTPIFQAMTRKFNVEDVTRALYERPDVFAVGQTGCNRFCVKYIQEHYGVDVDFVGKSTHANPSDVIGQYEQCARSDTASRADRDALPLRR